MGKATLTNGPLLQAKVATRTTAEGGVIAAFAVSHNGQRDQRRRRDKRAPVSSEDRGS
jgi:hypothetical protein